MDTLPGGRVFVSNPGPAEGGPGVLYRLEETLRIGRRAGGSEADLFSRVSGVQVDSKGRIYVADTQAQEIRVFDSGGAHLNSFGKQGKGPGEFNLISGMAIHPSGTLWVMDPSNARLTRFTSGGVLEGTSRRNLGYYATIPWAGQFDASGRLYDLERDSTQRGKYGRMYVRYTVGPGQLLQPLDTLHLPAFAYAFHAYSQGSIQILSTVPYSPSPLYALSRDGSVWIGNTGEYRFHRLNFHGDTLLTVELRVAPTPLSRMERDSAAATVGLSGSEMPRVRPAVRFFFTDTANRLWVRPELPTGDLPAWDLFTPEGIYLGRILSSVRIETDQVLPVALADGLLGVVKDDVGVEYVVRARLVPVESQGSPGSSASVPEM